MCACAGLDARDCRRRLRAVEGGLVALVLDPVRPRVVEGVRGTMGRRHGGQRERQECVVVRMLVEWCFPLRRGKTESGGILAPVLVVGK